MRRVQSKQVVHPNQKTVSLLQLLLRLKRVLQNQTIVYKYDIKRFLEDKVRQEFELLLYQIGEQKQN
jgi:hypothetical protein